MLYLDAAATTPVRREVIEAMFPYLTGQFGNPSSKHEVGKAAARALEQSRAEIAQILQCPQDGVIFTSGGTEADNLALAGIAQAVRGREPQRDTVVVGAVEHPAVARTADYLAAVHGFKVHTVAVESNGAVSAAALAELPADRVAVASFMYTNNEVGAINDLPALAAGLPGVVVHTDAVQAAGFQPLGMASLGVQALSLSGHKLAAPKGSGLLALAEGVPLQPVIHGGGQQRGARSGTENVAFAVALATALRLAEAERQTALHLARQARQRLVAGLKSIDPAVTIFGEPESTSTQCQPNILAFGFTGSAGSAALNGESVLLALEERSVVASSGSACAAGSTEPSETLLAMGLAESAAHTMVRFSYGALNDGDVDQVLAALADAVAQLRGLGR